MKLEESKIIVSGGRAMQRRKPCCTRDSIVAPPSLTIRRPSAWAASTYTGSLSVVSAWSGVLVRGRLTAHTLRLGASKVIMDGYGEVRRHCV